MSSCQKHHCPSNTRSLWHHDSGRLLSAQGRVSISISLTLKNFEVTVQYVVRIRAANPSLLLSRFTSTNFTSSSYLDGFEGWSVCFCLGRMRGFGIYLWVFDEVPGRQSREAPSEDKVKGLYVWLHLLVPCFRDKGHVVVWICGDGGEREFQDAFG